MAAESTIGRSGCSSFGFFIYTGNRAVHENLVSNLVNFLTGLRLGQLFDQYGSAIELFGGAIFAPNRNVFLLLIRWISIGQ